MIDEQDPEVRADLELRERTARERLHVSDAGFAAKVRDAATPKIIGKVPCRARCGQVADWTAEAEDAFQTFNARLAADGDAPLDKTRIVFCDACRKRGVATAGQSNRNHVETLRAAIAELKAKPPTPDEERAAIKRLAALRHPFAEEAVRSIVENESKRSKASRRRAEDY